MASSEVGPNTGDKDESADRLFVRRAAVTTALIAVALAVVGMGGSNASQDVQLAQQQVSDQWAFYQSKVMREHLYRIEKQHLEDDLLEKRGSLSPEALSHKEALLDHMRKEEERYTAEKKEIELVARGHEQSRDLNQRKHPHFQFGAVLLQIAIVLAAMAILTHARPVFYAALGAAALGALLGANGFWLFFRVPFLGH
ncbi:MAG TPA: DUF4337 domain-containing protein [Vicinamibacteria bacterium]|nr:DUF4337 domain-containing protein [Vicinamibacteria bacterium]